MVIDSIWEDLLGAFRSGSVVFSLDSRKGIIDMRRNGGLKLRAILSLFSLDTVKVSAPLISVTKPTLQYHSMG